MSMIRPFIAVAAHHLISKSIDQREQTAVSTSADITEHSPLFFIFAYDAYAFPHLRDIDKTSLTKSIDYCGAFRLVFELVLYSMKNTNKESLYITSISLREPFRRLLTRRLTSNVMLLTLHRLNFVNHQFKMSVVRWHGASSSAPKLVPPFGRD